MSYTYFCCGITYPVYHAVRLHVFIEHFDSSNAIRRPYLCTDPVCRSRRLGLCNSSKSACDHIRRNHFSTGIREFHANLAGEREQVPEIRPPEQGPEWAENWEDIRVDFDGRAENEEDSDDEGVQNEPVNPDINDVPYFLQKANEFSILLNKIRSSVRCSEKDFIEISKGIFDFAYDLGSEQNLDGNDYANIRRYIVSKYKRDQLIEELFDIPKFEVHTPVERKPKCKVYYLPIRTVAQRLFRTHMYQEYFEKDREAGINRETRSRGRLTSYRDNAEYIAPDDCYDARLEIYADDFSLWESQRSKVYAVYATYNNLPYLAVSKRSDILPVLFASRSTLDTIGIRNLYSPLLAELEELSVPSDFGLALDVKFSVCAFIGDNLASNEVMEISTGFRHGDACRNCDIKRSELKTTPNRMGRPRDHTQEHIFSSITAGRFIYPQDIFHDFHEGIVRRFMGDLIRFSMRHMSLDSLNAAIQAFPWKNGAIKTIGDQYDINGTGAQIIDFFFFFPLVVQVIPHNSSPWKLYVRLRNIYNAITTPVVQLNKLPILEQKISEFLERYYETFGEPHIIFKMHFLKHYPALMKQFGPLERFSSLRFERFHQSFKQKIRPSNNRRNLPFSIANIARTFVLQTIMNNSSTEIFFDPNKQNHVEIEEFRQFFEEQINLENVESGKSIEIGGRKIKVDDLFYYSTEAVRSERNPNPGIIERFIQCTRIYKYTVEDEDGYYLLLKEFDFDFNSSTLFYTLIENGQISIEYFYEVLKFRKIRFLYEEATSRIFVPKVF